MSDYKSYANFVEHPRYGRQPHFTGLNPQTNFEGSIFLHWHSPQSCPIDNTATFALDRDHDDFAKSVSIWMN